MPKIVLQRAWKETHPSSTITPQVFTNYVKGKRVKGTDHYATNGTINWFTIEFSDGSYVDIDDNANEGVLCTFVEMPRD